MTDLAKFQPMVNVVRQKFLSKYDGNILDDTYDERDVDWVKEDDSLIRTILGTYRVGGNEAKAVDALNAMLLFRAKWQVNDITEESLHQDLRTRDGIYYHGVDNDGRKLLQFRVCKQKKGQLVEESKKYIVYYMNKHYREHPDQQIATLFDFIDAGVGNMDMDISKFIIHLQTDYFPGITAYTLMFKMNPAIEVIWKILKSTLDADQSKNTHFVKRSNIQQYVDKSHLMPHQQKEEKK